MRILAGLAGCVLCGYDLPELPRIDTSGFLPAIRSQMERALADVKAHPRDPQLAGTLAMTLHAYQQYPAAVLVYSRARALEPQNFNWVYLAGAAELADGHFDNAAQSFREALRFRPDDLPASLRLAESLVALSRLDEAGALYQRILEQHQSCAQAWYALGRLHTAKREHDAAAECYAKACDLFPKFGMAHFALAGELRRLGRQAESKAHLDAYSRDVTLEPPLDDPLFERIHALNLSGQIHLQRAQELEKAGRLQEAIQENEAALSTDSTNPQIRVNLISLYGRTGNPAKARQNFEEAIALNPGRSDAWYNLGVLLFHDSNYGEAETAFRRALEINPYYAEAHNNLGAIYEQQGHLDDAAKEFRKSIDDRPDYPLARFHLGRILANQEKYDEAIHQFERSLTPEDDQTPVYLYALAATYARAGDRQHALTYFERAREAALARGQTQLLNSIERDRKLLDAVR